MIDIKLLRERPEIYRENTKKKFKDAKIIDSVLKLDVEWRKIKSETDNFRSERNKISEQINQEKKKGKDVSHLLKHAREIPELLKNIEEKENEIYEHLKKELYKIPNLMSKRVPIGKNENENKVEKIYGKPKKKSFEVK